MTELPSGSEFERVRERVLALYIAAAVLMFIGIGVLALYSFRLGPLVGPGVEESFGLAAALMFLMGALAAHLLDWSYRVWPLGRRVRPTPPLPVTDRSWALVISVTVLVVAGGAIAYLIGGLLS